MANMMRPEELIEQVRPRIKGNRDMTVMVIYSWTFPNIGSEMSFSPWFTAELIDECLGKSLRCEYSYDIMDWFQ